MKEAKKLLLFIAGTALVITAVGMYSNYSAGKPPIPGVELPSNKPPENVYKKIKVAGKDVDVRVAGSTSERKIGLSETSKLSENEGMLFILEKENTMPAFWMKDMEIAIDIIWINDGKIVKIDSDARPEPGKKDSELKLYKPATPVDYVLEVNSGWSLKNGIKVGDSVQI